MEVRFAQSARRHRVGKVHALAAMENAGELVVVPASSGQEDDRLLFTGKDDPRRGA